MTAARSTTTIDDPRVRVTTWTFEAAGETTGPHRHEFDYIVVPVTGGTLAVTTPDGASRAMTQQAGAPYRGTAGTDHTVTATGGETICFVEIEIKS